MADREGAVVVKGHEAGTKAAAALLEEFGLPPGLLPLAEVAEVGFVRATGFMWIAQRRKVEHHFKMAGKHVSYDVEITGYVMANRIRKLSGVKAKELMLWPPVNDITVDHDEQPSSSSSSSSAAAAAAAAKVHFKSLAGITKTFPVEAFAAGQ